MTLAKGTVALGRYVVADLVGEGGMGQVYRCHHHRLGLPVALKVLTDRSSPGIETRFEREAMLMARVRHTNVVGILDYGFLDDGCPCIVMELLEGVPLDKMLKQRGAFPWQLAIKIHVDVLAGLGALHQAGVLHRDLKPGNVLLVGPRRDSVKLIDFGIAQPTGEEAARLTRTGMIVGTPAYMAPEQLLCGTLDARTDLYASGLLLWEMLAGTMPCGANDLRAVLQRLQQPMPAPPIPADRQSPPGAVLEVLAHALLADVDQRPASARALAEEMVKAAKSSPSSPRPPATPQAAAPPSPPQPATPVHTPTAEETAENTAVPVTSDSSEFQMAQTMMAPSQAGMALSEMGGSTGSPVADFRAAPEPVRRRFLLAARLPSSVLAKKEHRQWLATEAASTARGYALGASLWFALQTRPTEEATAREQGKALAASIRQQFGELVVAAVEVVDEEFQLSAAALTGASPMPEALAALLERL